MVYSADRIPGVGALDAQERLVALLSYKLKQEYQEMCRFVRARMSLEVVGSNSLLLRGPWDKGTGIRQRPQLKDEAIMALLAPWWGFIEGIQTKMTGEEEVKELSTVMVSSWRIARKTSESAYNWGIERAGKMGIV